MHPLEIFLTTITFILYPASALVCLGGLGLKKNPLSAKAYYLFGLAVLGHTAIMVSRTVFAGHLPIFGMYEAALADSWALGAFSLLAMAVNRKYQLITVPSVFLIMILFLQGLGHNVNYIPLTISEQSLWVDLHAILAWVAFGFYGIAFALSLILLSPAGWALKTRLDLREEAWEDATLRAYLLGFLAQTAMIALGSFYAYLLFGTWWKWDPVEILSLISWVASALIIHMKLFYGWSQRRFQILVVLAFLALLVSYKFLIYFPGWSTYHIFDIDIKMH